MIQNVVPINKCCRRVLFKWNICVVVFCQYLLRFLWEDWSTSYTSYILHILKLSNFAILIRYSFEFIFILLKIIIFQASVSCVNKNDELTSTITVVLRRKEHKWFMIRYTTTTSSIIIFYMKRIRKAISSIHYSITPAKPPFFISSSFPTSFGFCLWALYEITWIISVIFLNGLHLC